MLLKPFSKSVEFILTIFEISLIVICLSMLSIIILLAFLIFSTELLEK